MLVTARKRVVSDGKIGHHRAGYVKGQKAKADFR
jgi:hypothetical protein